MRGGAARRLAVALLHLVTATGCGRSTARSGGATATTASTASGVTETTAVGDHGTTTDTTAPGTARRSTATTGATATTARTPGGGSGAADPVAAAARGPVGSFAGMLLHPQPAPRLVVELLQQSGADHDPSAVDHVTSVLRSVSGKAVTVPAVAPVGSTARAWDEASIAAAADASTKQPQGGGQAVIHLLYLRGSFKGDSSVLGITVRGDVLAVFVDQVAGAASVTLPESTIEDVVTMHETGHVLGLVDLYLHTGRQDPDHPGHSSNRRSVMYWAVDSSLIGQILGGNPPRDFDSADLHDIATIRAGA